MAKCKYCDQTISRLSKDICPFCGGKKPLDGTDTTTQDITKVLGQSINSKKYKRCSKVIAAILAFTVGFLGISSFYIKKPKMGLIILAFSALLIGGIGSFLYFIILKNLWVYLVPYFIIEFFMIFIGINYLSRHDLTDGNGEFLV